MRPKLVLVAMGIALLATGVAWPQHPIRLDKDKCCEPATREPPPPQNCETDCLQVGIFCDPAPVVGSWKNGSCKNRAGSSCRQTVTPRPTPIYECTAIPCLDLHGHAGEKCVWKHVGDTGPVQPAVNSCIGNRC